MSSNGDGRYTGTVKWFNSQKGYGFIVPDKNGDVDMENVDVFVHYSAIEGSGYRQLNENDHVEFSVEKSKKGLHAKEVVIL